MDSFGRCIFEQYARETNLKKKRSVRHKELTVLIYILCKQVSMGHSINASCVQKCLCMRKICASIFNLILVPKPSLDLVNGAESKFIGIKYCHSDAKSTISFGNSVILE